MFNNVNLIKFTIIHKQYSIILRVDSLKQIGKEKLFKTF